VAGFENFVFVLSANGNDWLHAEHQFTLLIHGDARGADWLAGEWAKERGVEVACPADWRRRGRGAGPIHNRQMLDEHPDLVCDVPKWVRHEEYDRHRQEGRGKGDRGGTTRNKPETHDHVHRQSVPASTNGDRRSGINI
jgi:hypothetical protein